MARYWRRRYRRLRRRYRRYKRRSARVINNSSRSRARVRIRSSCSVSVNVGIGSFFSDVVLINPWMSQASAQAAAGNALVDATLKTGLCESNLYESMSRLYDEVKLDGLKIKCTIQDAIGLNGAFNSLKILSAWDRKMKANEVQTTQSYPNAEAIEAHGTYAELTALNNTVARFNRSLWASDLTEKNTFVESAFDTHALRVFGVQRNFCCNNSYANEVGNLVMFAPVFLIAFQVPTAAQATRTVHVNFDCIYWVTFRSPKYGMITNYKDLPAKSVAFVDDAPAPAPDVPDGDMDDDDGPVINVDAPSASMVRPHGVSGITPDRQRIRRFGHDLPEGTVTISTRDTDDIEDPHARPSAADAAEAT